MSIVKEALNLYWLELSATIYRTIPINQFLIGTTQHSTQLSHFKLKSKKYFVYVFKYMCIHAWFIIYTRVLITTSLIQFSI